MPENEPKRQGQVQRELDLANKEAERLYTVACELGGRLIPVLRQPDPPSDKEASVAQELVPLASEIRSIRYKIESATKEIEDYYSRLEL